MGDVDPTQQIQQQTPRQTTLVDAFAEQKRITDAIMRSNPLLDARIDGGLMQWKGNYYNKSHDNSDYFLWIGEIVPMDAVLDKPQRGFILLRDDPDGQGAITMYDPWAAEANATDQPVRQVLALHDADGRGMLVEDRWGGVGFPWGHIPLLPQIFDQEGTTVRPAINGAKQGENRQLFYGVGSMIGNSVYLQATCNSTGPTYRFWVEIEWQNGDTFTSQNFEGSGFLNIDEEWDFRDFPERRFGWVKVEIWGTHTAGGDEWSWMVPKECFSRPAQTPPP